jgi:hypothetical protein
MKIDILEKLKKIWTINMTGVSFTLLYASPQLLYLFLFFIKHKQMHERYCKHLSSPNNEIIVYTGSHLSSNFGYVEGGSLFISPNKISKL